MFKILATALALTVLVGCQATTTTDKIAEKVVAVEPPKLAGQVVGITEVCKTLEHQLNIFNAFSISKTAGMQIY